MTTHALHLTEPEREELYGLVFGAYDDARFTGADEEHAELLHAILGKLGKPESDLSLRPRAGETAVDVVERVTAYAQRMTFSEMLTAPPTVELADCELVGRVGRKPLIVGLRDPDQDGQDLENVNPSVYVAEEWSETPLLALTWSEARDLARALKHCEAIARCG